MVSFRDAKPDKKTTANSKSKLSSGKMILLPSMRSSCEDINGSPKKKLLFQI
jgi:hypothetical protein